MKLKDNPIHENEKPDHKKESHIKMDTFTKIKDWMYRNNIEDMKGTNAFAILEIQSKLSPDDACEILGIKLELLQEKLNRKHFHPFDGYTAVNLNAFLERLSKAQINVMLSKLFLNQSEDMPEFIRKKMDNCTQIADKMYERSPDNLRKKPWLFKNLDEGKYYDETRLKTIAIRNSVWAAQQFLLQYFKG